MSTIPTTTLSRSLLTNLSNPMAFIALLQALRERDSGGGYVPKGAAPALPQTAKAPAPTPAPAPAPATAPATRAKPSVFGGGGFNEFDAMREHATDMRDAELAALARTPGYSPLSLKRISERFENRMGGIAAQERAARTKAEIPARRAEQEAAKAERRQKTEQRIAERKASRAAAFDRSYTSVEDARARAALDRMAAAPTPTAPAPAPAPAPTPAATPAPVATADTTQSTQTAEPVKSVSETSGAETSAPLAIPSTFGPDAALATSSSETTPYSPVIRGVGELVNLFTPWGYDFGHISGIPYDNQRKIREAQARIMTAVREAAGLPNTMDAQLNMPDYAQRMESTFDRMTENMEPELREQLRAVMRSGGAFPRPTPAPAAAPAPAPAPAPESTPTDVAAAPAEVGGPSIGARDLAGPAFDFLAQEATRRAMQSGMQMGQDAINAGSALDRAATQGAMTLAQRGINLYGDVATARQRMGTAADTASQVARDIAVQQGMRAIPYFMPSAAPAPAPTPAPAPASAPAQTAVQAPVAAPYVPPAPPAPPSQMDLLIENQFNALRDAVRNHPLQRLLNPREEIYKAAEQARARQVNPFQALHERRQNEQFVQAQAPFTAAEEARGRGATQALQARQRQEQMALEQQERQRQDRMAADIVGQFKDAAGLRSVQAAKSAQDIRLQEENRKRLEELARIRAAPRQNPFSGIDQGAGTSLFR